MKRARQATLMVVSLSVLWLGLFCGRVAARFGSPERGGDLPRIRAPNWKRVAIPHFETSEAAPPPSSRQSHTPLPTAVSHAPAPASSTGLVRVAVTQANLRGRPTLNAPIIATLRKGETGEISERDHGWTRVTTTISRFDGWIRDDLLVPDSVANEP